MSESLKHQQLVNLIFEKTIAIVGKNNVALIAIDSEKSGNLPPLTVEGYRPDVFYCFNGILIIGEAKTGTDAEKQHSLNQYESYIKKCSLFQGEATLIIAVPWTERITIYNLTQRLRKLYPGDYSIIVIDELGVRQ